ncbi:hypothetical protein CfE428DRAFT_1004 [Chthoniobacter flavus Ellin428]|uniref:Uncharacterized protein n=1 Tax=Chthoniobacter flavus Ellin428 TaxID=497964 RepID=B4CWG7_9BACT|nr:hypothetical protein [Chthoniobacter flavus]EDY21759.1 hypothetical protein CfE428DRAFT_1004 [Chthoniobacter flavus Ellin428]TCO95691.1 hypothetical protein EV701_101381 [Chthoniobacter flavus]
MKYVVLLIIVVGVYFFLVHKAPVAPVVKEITQQDAAPLTSGPNNPPAAASPGTNVLKRPIDRTKEVLNQVKQRNGKGEF